MAKILLVDDDSDMREMIALMLDGLHEIKGCGDADEALGALETEDYDLLITDVVMPKQSGLELSSMIKQKGNDMPVLVISGQYTGDEGDMEFASYFSEETLAKPFEKEALVAKIEHILSNADIMSSYYG